MEEIERLREQLAAAVAAAGDAYRHTSRLIRVLTVLGRPSSPAELVDQTLAVLSQIYAADVTATVRVTAGRLTVSSSCGIPEGDPAYTDGWPLGGGALEALTGGRAVTRGRDTLDLAADVPPSMAGLAPGSAVWVPVGEAGVADELLVMYRVSDDGFPAADLPVLGSVAARLRVAVESRERSAAVERLATLGHRLSSRLELPSLYEEILRILPVLVDAEYAGLMRMEDGTATLCAATPSDVLGLYGDPVPATQFPGWETVRNGGVYTGDFDSATPTGTILAVPVMRDGTPIAVLCALRADRRPFRRDAIDSVGIFANYVSSAITNAELYLALGRSEAELRRRATHDPLTGVANRALTAERLEAALDRADDDHVGLLFCDLDKFKQVNDRLGHEAGDTLLRHVADRLRACVREDDLLARFGGDEFVILLDGVDDLGAVTEIGDHVVRALRAPFWLYGEWVQIGVSVGGVLGVRGVTQPGAMLRDADAAMYAAKNAGRGRIEVLGCPVGKA